jgi:hypothetical protein
MQISTRFMHQNFDEDDNLSVLTGVYEHTLNVPINKHSNFLVSFPVTFYKEENKDAQHGIGNLYLAYQTRKHFEDSIKASDRYISSATFGVHLPMASEDDIFPRYFISYLVDRYEIYKYAPDLLTLFTNYTYQYTTPQNVFFGFEAGPYYMISTEGDDLDDLNLHYGLSCGYRLKYFTFSMEMVGIIEISTGEDYANFSDRLNYNLIDVGITFENKYIEAGIHYSFYYFAEYLFSNQEGVFGLKIDVPVK